mmetsp:Transcript_42390/g.119898  ORF Transcript_42390/g.119898 Transcript_42390/m.119898 type:complete len:277 (-) Transcript_42390:28-858(-)
MIGSGSALTGAGLLASASRSSKSKSKSICFAFCFGFAKPLGLGTLLGVASAADSLLRTTTLVGAGVGAGFAFGAGLAAGGAAGMFIGDTGPATSVASSMGSTTTAVPPLALLATLSSSHIDLAVFSRSCLYRRANFEVYWTASLVSLVFPMPCCLKCVHAFPLPPAAICTIWSGVNLSSSTLRTKEMCTPFRRCSPEHSRQRYTPYVSEIHVGFLAVHSKQVRFSFFIRSFRKIPSRTSSGMKPFSSIFESAFLSKMSISTDGRVHQVKRQGTALA